MSVMSVMLSLLLSLPCPALPYLCCVSRCSCGAASTVPYRSPGALGPRLSLGTCDARLHSAKVPCAEDKVPVVAGTWPPAHQYNASTPPLSGRALFFFLQVPSPGIAGLGAPPVGGSPSYHNRRHTPLPFLHSPPRLACLLPPCASAVRACACNLLAGPESDHRQSLKLLLQPVTAIPGARLGTVRCHFEPLKKQHHAAHHHIGSQNGSHQEGHEFDFFFFFNHQALGGKLNVDWQHFFLLFSFYFLLFTFFFPSHFSHAKPPLITSIY